MSPARTSAVAAPVWTPPRASRARRAWSLTWRILVAIVTGLLAFAVVHSASIEATGTETDDLARTGLLIVVDVLLAPIAIGLIALRRNVVAASAIVLLSSVSSLSAGAVCIAIVSIAAARSLRVTLVLGVVFVASSVASGLLVPEPDVPWWATPAIAVVLYVILALLGLLIGSRRRLITSLRFQADSARREQQALADGARSAERSRIAREMHDALGHRLSLIAMHAGALESRDDLSPAETRVAAGVVRESAHQAMTDLREVLGVLRESSPGSTDAADAAGGTDLPTLDHLDDLVAAGIGGDAIPTVRWMGTTADDLATLPESTSRHLFRFAQEALTNVRRHAVGRPTEITVEAEGKGASRSIAMTVRNRAAPSGPEDGAVSTDRAPGYGLTGLSERARLAGGTLTTTADDEWFTVRMVLPWPM